MKYIITTAAKESLGTKKKWNRKRGLRKWDDNVAKIITDKREALKKFQSTGTLVDEMEYRKKRALAKREVRKNHRKYRNDFVVQL